MSGLVFDFLAFAQRPESFSINIRMMREEIIAAVVGRDEPKPFLIVEPFYRTRCHYTFSFAAPIVSGCHVPLKLHDQLSPEGCEVSTGY